MDTQVSVIDGNSDIATLTVGGNDIGFGDAANACVFKVNRIPDCSATLANTGNRIANDLPPKMDSLLIAIMNQVKNPGFKLYVTG
jgi:lysophospholipase L1-like esterase